MFVTIEGLDFSGKSTLVRYLKELLDEAPPTYFTREPGGTLAAERIREILLDPEVEMDPWTEAYLYASARADHVRGGILPRLERGENVVCERYLDSSVAYQGYGRGLGADAVRELNSWATEDILPDRTFYLRLGVEERERRAREGRGSLDRIERIGAEFMRRVERGFEEIIRLAPGRFFVLDATLPPEELAETVRREMEVATAYNRGGEE
ncbi:MAG: dTMP kinase [Rubrobacteraceae bacterium]